MKPVAWMSPDGKFSTTEGKLFHTPLYTAPKKLSDEEIIEAVKDHFIGAIKIGIVLTNDNVLGFAKAVLKKASEK
jgi:hypothetical protein